MLVASTKTMAIYGNCVYMRSWWLTTKIVVVNGKGVLPLKRFFLGREGAGLMIDATVLRACGAVSIIGSCSTVMIAVVYVWLKNMVGNE